jgi:hypothetical protein
VFHAETATTVVALPASGMTRVDDHGGLVYISKIERRAANT